MTETLSPYPEYRQVGLSWMRKVPSHWRLARLKESVVNSRNGIWGNDPDGINDIPCVRVADFDRGSMRVRIMRPTLRAVTESERRGRLLQSGDLLLEKSGGGELQPVGAVMLYDHEESAVCSNFIMRMPVSPGFDPRFLVYLHAVLYSFRLNVRAIKQTTGIQNLDEQSYLAEAVAYPPGCEQRTIARFLDRQDRRISRFIRAKRRLIELLTEQKQAIIHQAVTRGLDPDVPLKPCGIDWLGEVPAHWEVRSIKSCLESITSGLWGEEPSNEPGMVGVPCVRVADFRMDTLSTINPIPTIRAIPDQALKSRVLSSGDLLIEKSGGGERQPVGRVVSYDSSQPAICSNFVVRLRTIEDILKPRFLLYWLHDLQVQRRNVFSIKQTTGIQNLDTGDYFTNPVVIPPKDEQAEIITAINQRVQAVDVAIGRTQREIELIREYRTRLIADVVTGKIDVRDHPDAAEDAPLDDLDMTTDDEPFEPIDGDGAVLDEELEEVAAE